MPRGLRWRDNGDGEWEAPLADGHFVSAHVYEDATFEATIWDFYGEEVQYWTGSVVGRRGHGRQVMEQQP